MPAEASASETQDAAEFVLSLAISAEVIAFILTAFYHTGEM